jgi:hypothetical protein
MGNRSTRRKPAPVLFCPPQTPHAARPRTRAAAVGSQRLSAWTTPRPFQRPSFTPIQNQLLTLTTKYTQILWRILRVCVRSMESHEVMFPRVLWWIYAVCEILHSVIWHTKFALKLGCIPDTFDTPLYMAVRNAVCHGADYIYRSFGALIHFLSGSSGTHKPARNTFMTLYCNELTHQMKLSPSWDASSCSVSEWIPNMSSNLKVN